MDYKEFLERARQTLCDYTEEIALSLKYMDKYRCDLNSASDILIGIIDDIVRDYCLDNDLDFDNFDTYVVWGKEYEDIFFDAIGTEY